MTVYRKTKGLRGGWVYWRGTDFIDNKLEGGKMMKSADVPANIVDLLKAQEVVDDTEVKKFEKPYKRCIFCGAETKWSRMLNGETVAICEEHYQSKTLGEIAKQVKDLEKPDYEAIDKLLNGPK